MSHEPGPMRWERLEWTETRKCAMPQCEKVAVYELSAEGMWPVLHCLRHTPIHAMPNYGPFPLEMAAGCSQCVEYEAVLGVLQSNMVYSYSRGWNTDEVNDHNAAMLLWLDERLPWRSEHGSAREYWRARIQAVRDEFREKREAVRFEFKYAGGALYYARPGEVPKS